MGIVTDRDVLMKVLAKQADIPSTTIKELISQETLTLKETEGFKETLQKMADKRVRRAPMVDGR